MYYEEQQRKDRLAFLNDTVKHFNSTNRAVTYCEASWNNERCVYSPTLTSVGCAIGRKLPVEMAKAIDEKFPEGIGVCNLSIREFIPKEMKELGFNFLGRIQGLHDDKSFWDEKGITEKGIGCVREIITEFELG